MAQKDENIYAPAHGRDGFDARHDGEENRGPLLLVVTVAVLLAFAAVVYTAYHQGLRKGGRDAAPHVTAEPGPIKTRSSETHGTPTPNLGNRAYEPLDDVKAAPTSAIKTAPLSEEPLARPAKVEIKKPTVRPAAKKAEPKTVPVQSKPKSKAIQPAKQKPRPTVTGGAFVVQIAAFRSNAKALEAWSSLSSRLSQATKGLAPDVQRADLGAKGVYYRLRASSFVSREAAKGFCDQLKKSGQDCLVVRR